MCLGEGTGAAALFPLLDMAAAVYGQMESFEEIPCGAVPPFWKGRGRMKDLNLIELTDLEKRYGKKEALTGINLTIGRGKIIGLLGPNGSGKTTLIKLLNGLLQPTSSEIKVNGKAPGVDSKKIISYLPDKMYFADWMKIADLMDFFGRFLRRL